MSIDRFSSSLAGPTRHLQQWGSSGFSPSPPRGHEERTAERCRCSFPTSGGAPTHFCIVYVCCFKLFFFCLPNFLLVSFYLYCISCGVSSPFWLISVLCSLDFDFLCCVIDWSHFSSPKNWYVECSKYRVMQKQKYRVMQKQKSLGCCLVIPLFFYRQLSL